MLGIAKKLFGSENDRKLKKLRPIVDRINALEPQMEAMSDEDALVLIRSNNQKIMAESQSLEFDQAAAELEGLTAKAAIAELSEQEQARRESLSAYIRDQLSQQS